MTDNLNTYTIDVAMSPRAYGLIEVQAASPQAAIDSVTPEMVADRFTLHGNGADDLDYHHPCDIWISNVLDDQGDETGNGCLEREVPDGPWINRYVTIYTIFLDTSGGCTFETFIDETSFHARVMEWCSAQIAEANLQHDAGLKAPQDWQDALDIWSEYDGRDDYIYCDQQSHKLP